MPEYIIETKSDKVLISVPKNADPNKERMTAFAKYFYDIIEGKVSLDKIGCIIMLHKPEEKDEKNWYPFRVAPLLWKMNIIGTPVAVDSVLSCIGGTRKQAKVTLKECAEADADLIPLIEDIKLELEGGGKNES